jgi:hypothetical protein
MPGMTARQRRWRWQRTHGMFRTGSVGPTVMLPAMDEIGTNLGAGVLDFRSGYAAWKSTSTPRTFTCVTSVVSDVTAPRGSRQTSKCSRIASSGAVTASPVQFAMAYPARQQVRAGSQRRHTPAFAMTTSSRPATFLISSTAARLSASFADVSLTTCSAPGCDFASAFSSVAASGSRAPAKTMVSGRAASTWASARPAIRER